MDWLYNQPDYGLCDPPMSDSKALEFLTEYLVPNIQVAMPERNAQINTVIVFEILKRYSKRFRKEMKKEKTRSFLNNIIKMLGSY